MAAFVPYAHMFAASTHLQLSSTMAVKFLAPPTAPSMMLPKGGLWCSKKQGCTMQIKTANSCSKIFCAMNMAAGQSDEAGRLNLDRVKEKAKVLWDCSPQPIKSFPWSRVLENFIQLIIDLLLAVIKYLYVPVMAVSSLSEMSYCAHERKLFLIPLPLLVGVAMAGVIRKTALELSPLLKDSRVPWHLISMAVFFTLVKLPGPYYPYWGRIFIPHFANGGLLRTLWFALLWYRRPPKRVNGNLAEQK